MVSEICVSCIHHAIGYFDTVTVLDHPTHACIASYYVCSVFNIACNFRTYNFT